MKKALRRTLKISGLVLGAIVLLVLAAVLLVLFDKPLVKNLIQNRLRKGVGTTASLGRLDYSVFPFRVTVESPEFGQEDAFQKLGLSATRLEARGSFWKLVRGVKPALDAIEAEGVSLRLEQKAESEEPLDIEKILVQASDALAWAKLISVTNGRLSILLPAERADFENLDLTLTPDPARDIVAYSIGHADLSVKGKEGSLLFTAGLATSGSLGLVSPFSVDATFALGSPHFAISGIEGTLDSLALAVTGRFDRSVQELTLSRLKIGIPGLLDFEGTATGRLGHGLFLEAQAKARFDNFEAAAALLGPKLPADLRAAKLRGRGDLTGSYALQRSDQEFKDNLSASLSLEDIELAPVVAGRPLRVRARGRIDAAGSSKDPRLSADIRSSFGAVSLAGLTVASSDLHLVASGPKGSVAVSGLDARLAGLSFAAAAGTKISFEHGEFSGRGSVDLIHKSAVLTSLEARLAGLVFDAAPGKKISFDRAALSGKGSVDLASKSAVLTSLEADLPGLAPLRVSGKYGPGGRAASELRLESRGLDIPSLRALAAPFIPAGFSGWELGGAIDLSLSARRPAAPPDSWAFSGALALSGATFNDPSFTIAGEGLNPVFKVEGTGSASKGLSFTGSLDIDQGESLWKSVYVSWSKSPLNLTLAGRYDPGSRGFDGLVVRALLPTIGEIDVTGAARMGPGPSFDLETKASLSLKPLYSLFTQSGVSDEARMKIEGTLGATLRARGDGEALSIGGRVSLADTNLERPLTKTILLGVAADLPVLYESDPAAAAASEAPLAEEGFLRIGEFQNSLLTLKSVNASLRAGVNALAIEPLSLELFGGRLELGRTTFRLDPAAGSFQGVGSLALRDIDISRFPFLSPQLRLTGKIQAEFPRLDISPDKIAISGRGEASVFGGKIVLRDLGVTDPFAPGRSISLNVDLVDLDLKKLTDEVPFGEVTGIVRGEVRDLIITYGQPERFDLRLETVRRKGVPQTFSLKAVDDLTVISSGQRASGGTGNFWMSFIRGFRYRKLGIVSTLRNDTFTLNGTIHEGGTEYLVKKPALFGISVVNRMPKNVISFKEMTSRLKRVGQSEK